jgi:D-sedoheptulose 7-phosphate isomerase
MNPAQAIRLANRVYVIGNGGSMANATHIVNDLLSCGIRAFDVNQAFFSATANDCGYEHSYRRWIEIVAEPGDLLIALSGSGESPNVLEALREAKRRGAATLAVVGRQSTAAEIADAAIVHGPGMQEAEDYQLVLGHQVMKELRKEETCVR